MLGYGYGVWITEGGSEVCIEFFERPEGGIPFFVCTGHHLVQCFAMEVGDGVEDLAVLVEELFIVDQEFGPALLEEARECSASAVEEQGVGLFF